jgi:hypothetical protein
MSRKEIINLNNIVFLLFSIAMLISPITPEFIPLGQGFFVVAAVNLMFNNLIKNHEQP